MQTKTFFNFKTYRPLYFTNTNTKIAKNLLADIIVFMEDKAKKAEELFLSGYNCAQSVFCAFCEDFGIDFEVGLKMTSSMGGGMGRLREVCGAVSSMFLLVGLKRGYIENNNDEIKANHYKLIQDLADEFKNEFGSILCRDLLGEDRGSYVPDKRTEEYYKTRPCTEFIKYAAKLTEKIINEKAPN